MLFEIRKKYHKDRIGKTALKQRALLKSRYNDSQKFFIVVMKLLLAREKNI